jgi:probable HAF family extracellular repeat protein
LRFRRAVWRRKTGAQLFCQAGQFYSPQFSFPQIPRCTNASLCGIKQVPLVSSHAFLYTKGGMYDLGTLEGAFSEARGINAAGQVAGVSNLNGDPESRGFLHSHGSMQNIGTLYSDAPARKASWTNAINYRSQVAGASNLPVRAMASLGSLSATRYERGVLSSISQDVHEASAINDRGDIVGLRYDKDASFPAEIRPRAVLYRHGKLVELGTLAGQPGSSSFATGINHAGDNVGRSSADSGTTQQAFL